MTITPISPRELRSFCLPIAQRMIKTSPTRTKKRTVDFEDPDYDPEFDLIDARLQATKKKESSPPPFQSTQPLSLYQAPGIAEPLSGIRPYNGARRVHDKFTYFTLVEALVLDQLLDRPALDGPYTIRFNTKKIIKSKKRLISYLQIASSTNQLCNLQIIYDLTRSRYSIYSVDQHQKIGQVDFDLVGLNTYMEEANGHINGKSICLDPVWDPKRLGIIDYQRLQIGDRSLDLTSTSPDHRTGHWLARGQQSPIPFSVHYQATQTQTDHIMTQKKITVGPHRVRLDLYYFDDIFTEPYLANGSIRPR